MKLARQKGAALLVGMLLLMLAIAGLSASLLVASQGAGSDNLLRRQQLRALYEAERALITHALIEDSTPGTLPSPSGEHTVGGRSNPVGFAGTPGQQARRLPWHFLALDPAGECLWYAVSRAFRNNIPTRQRSTGNGTTINPGNDGELVIRNSTGHTTYAAAVLIAPGFALTTQPFRQPNKAPLCSGGPIDAFLEGPNLDGDGLFSSSASEDGNDIVRPVPANLLLKPVLRRVLGIFSSDDVRQGLLAASKSFHTPVTLDTIRCSFSMGEGTCPGERKFDALLARRTANELTYSAGCPMIGTGDDKDRVHPISWLCFNQWNKYIDYQPGERTLAVSAGDTHCTLELGTGSIRCARQANDMASDGTGFR